MKYSDTIVVEISGKASIIALLDFLRESEKNNKKYKFIFHIAYIPTEYDPSPERNIFAFGEILKMHVQRLDHIVEEMLFSAEVGTWYSYLQKTMIKSVSCPCIYCLIYAHVCRLSVAICNNAKILTGESINSGKITALQEDLRNKIDEYFGKYNVVFIRPLLNKDKEYVNNRFKEFCNEYELDENLYKFPSCRLYTMNDPTFYTKKQLKEIYNTYFYNDFDRFMNDMVHAYSSECAENNLQVCH